MTRYSFPQPDGRIATVDAPDGVEVLNVILPPKAPTYRRVTVEFGPDGVTFSEDMLPAWER